MKVMTERTLKRPKVLAPTRTLEKLKVVIRYSADAVYIGGNAYSLRSRTGNFTPEKMAEGVASTCEHDAKVHVAANTVAREGNQEGAGTFSRELRDIGISAVIVSDLALIEICATGAPGLPIHLSTQTSAASYETLESRKNEGLERVALACEVSTEEVAVIRESTDTEIEAFIHGATCISYSGRYTLSNHIPMRNTSRGGCPQSCHWKYELLDMPFGTERRSKTSEGEVEEEFSMSAVDMSMIEHIPELIENGADSFKTGDHMKSIHYASTVVNVYKKVVDSYMEDPENYVCRQEWTDKLWKVAQRRSATGFYYNTPGENEQLFGEHRRIPQYKFVGEVIVYNEKTQVTTTRQRNLLSVGDEIEFYGPGFTYLHRTVKEMYNEDGEVIDRAPNPMTLLTAEVTQPATVGDMIRKKK